MGLEIESEDGSVVLFSGTYPAFMRFRKIIYMAVKAVSAEDFKEHIRRESLGDADAIFELRKKLPPLASIDTFFKHSDCDGEWSTGECRLVRQLLEYVEDKLFMGKETAPEVAKTSEPNGREGPLKEAYERMDQIIARLQACGPVQPTEAQLLERFLRGLKYCIKHEQRAVFL